MLLGAWLSLRRCFCSLRLLLNIALEELLLIEWGVGAEPCAQWLGNKI